MGYPSLHTIPFVKKLAKMENTMESVARFSGLPRGCVRGVIKDVDDPQERGRVRVLFDMVNKDIPQVEGQGELSGERRVTEEYLSHWIDTSPAFKGKQPQGLIGKRVNVVLSNSQYQYAILQDVLHDVELLTDKAAAEYPMPNNSPMTRLPVYSAGELPPPCAENHGCTVIEDGGPMDSDWVCVCLKRDGEYLWVRHADLAHGHAGGNDGTQQVDSLGNRQNPVMLGTINDSVFPTTAKQFKQYSAYTTKPQGNPKGEQAHWYPPPMSDLAYTPGQDFDFLNPDPNGPLRVVREVAAFPPISTVISGFTPSFNPSIPTILQSKAQEVFGKAQKILEIADTARQVVENPSEFVKDQALSAAQGVAEQMGIPPATKAALGAIKDAQGFLQTPSLGAVTPLVSGVFSGLKSVLSSII